MSSLLLNFLSGFSGFSIFLMPFSASWPFLRGLGRARSSKALPLVHGAGVQGAGVPLAAYGVCRGPESRMRESLRERCCGEGDRDRAGCGAPRVESDAADVTELERDRRSSCDDAAGVREDAVLMERLSSWPATTPPC